MAVTAGRDAVLLASSGRRPGMLLDFLQYKGRLPKARGFPDQMSGAGRPGAGQS